MTSLSSTSKTPQSQIISQQNHLTSTPIQSIENKRKKQIEDLEHKLQVAKLEKNIANTRINNKSSTNSSLDNNQQAKRKVIEDLQHKLKVAKLEKNIANISKNNKSSTTIPPSPSTSPSQTKVVVVYIIIYQN